MIKGQATEVIDVGHFLPMAFADWFSRKEMGVVDGAIGALVDDSAFFRNMLAPVLKAAGYKVRVAVNAQEGLAALRLSHTFDVVLTDIEMPDMNGFEFAETIRADNNLSRCRSSPCPRWCRRRRSSAGGRPASTISSPSSTVPA